MDIGWQFEKLSNIPAQIRQLSMGGEARPPSTPHTPGSPVIEEPVTGEGPDTAFAQLKSFYNSQLAVSSGTDPLLTPSGGFNYASPASLARIMSIYNARAPFGKQKDTRTSIMRESAEESEGLRTVDGQRDREAIEKLRSSGWASTASIAQRADQKHPPRFVSDLRPTQSLLRTKRNKRCRTCRHILVKPEPKVQNTRFRIRLLAINYIPTITFAPLQPSSSPSAAHLPLIDLQNLPVLRASQYLLTLKNPLFESVKITLATPSHTPGRHQHKVTILCPDFSIGPNVDQWEEALGDGKNRRSSKLVTAGGGMPKAEFAAGGDGGKVAEAGKVWDKGRNWTSVVVEVVCAAVVDVKVSNKVGGVHEKEDKDEDEVEDEEEDDDVLEIPVFVRMEWEGEVAADDKEGKGEGKEKRELAFWNVIGVGKVGRLGAAVGGMDAASGGG